MDRADPVSPAQPLRSGHGEARDSEYVGHGTRSLYPALDVGTGHIQDKVAVRHTSAEFVDLFDTVGRTAPRGKAIHFVFGKLSAQKTRAVKDWLAAHPLVTMHCILTNSS